MATVTTKCEIEVYEIDGEEYRDCERKLRVESHRNRESMVVVTLGIETVTVKADDLLKAIQRCSEGQCP